jgi:replicative DNA helicase
MSRASKTGVCSVDYIGLVRGVRGAERRYQELGIITHTLKAMARRLGIVVVAVSQLNRQAASSDGPPQLHELRESGDIEQDADTVMLLHAPHLESANIHEQRQLDCIIAKQRSGRLGTIELGFVRDFCRIEEPQVIRELDGEVAA